MRAPLTPAAASRNVVTRTCCCAVALLMIATGPLGSRPGGQEVFGDARQALVWQVDGRPRWSDLAFFPAIGITVGPALLAGGRRHNAMVFWVLALLFAANALFYAELLGWAATTAQMGLLLALDTMIR